MSEELKDLFVETENLVFGRVAFFYMRIPIDWKAFPIPRRTDVESWVESDGIRWVSSGFTGLVLVNEEENLRQPLYINVKRNYSGVSISKLAGDELRKHNILSRGKLMNLESICLVYRKSIKKYLLFGPVKKEYVIKLLVNCRSSGRLLIIDIPVEEDPHRKLEFLKPYLETIRC